MREGNWIAWALVLAACGAADDPNSDAATGPLQDADTSTVDAGAMDGGTMPDDAGRVDAGPRPDDDAGTMDAGTTPRDDAGAVDADAAMAGDAGWIVDAGGDASEPLDAAIRMDASPRDGGGSMSPDGGKPPCIALPASGTLTFSGELTTRSATWRRPDDYLCPAEWISDWGEMYVDTYVFCETSGLARSYRIRMNGLDADPSLTLFDPYLVVYEGNGIPADPLMCLAINDDGGWTLDSEIPSVTVSPGQWITVAATTYDELGSGYEYGTYTLEITAL